MYPRCEHSPWCRCCSVAVIRPLSQPPSRVDGHPHIARHRPAGFLPVQPTSAVVTVHSSSHSPRTGPWLAPVHQWILAPPGLAATTRIRYDMTSSPRPAHNATLSAAPCASHAISSCQTRPFASILRRRDANRVDGSRSPPTHAPRGDRTSLACSLMSGVAFPLTGSVSDFDTSRKITTCEDRRRQEALSMETTSRLPGRSVPLPSYMRRRWARACRSKSSYKATPADAKVGRLVNAVGRIQFLTNRICFLSHRCELENHNIATES